VSTRGVRFRTSRVSHAACAKRRRAERATARSISPGGSSSEVAQRAPRGAGLWSVTAAAFAPVEAEQPIPQIRLPTPLPPTYLRHPQVARSQPRELAEPLGALRNQPTSTGPGRQACPLAWSGWTAKVSACRVRVSRNEHGRDQVPGMQTRMVQRCRTELHRGRCLPFLRPAATALPADLACSG
jgi:hypothetical protein